MSNVLAMRKKGALRTRAFATSMAVRCGALAVAAGIAVCLSCSADPVASGTGSSSEVEGFVFRTPTSPAAGAVVRLRSREYLNTIIFGETVDSLTIADTQTDGDGRFGFNGVKPGEYFIEAAAGTDGAVLIPLVIDDTVAQTILDTAFLERTGGLRGRVNLPISDDSAWVLVYGLERAVLFKTSQDFSVSDLPRGAYGILLWLRASGQSQGVWIPQRISVVPDSVTDIGTLNFALYSFFTGCRTADCDTQAVRDILVAAGLDSVSVRTVAHFDSVTGRVVRLDMHDRGVRTIDANIGALAELEELDISGNSLSLLPVEIGYCTKLRILRADSNAITAIPRELGYCDSLRQLSLSHNDLRFIPAWLHELPLTLIDINSNEIDSIPLDFTSLGTLDSIDVRGNRLCRPSDSVRQWLDSLQQNWYAGQRCSNYPISVGQ